MVLKRKTLGTRLALKSKNTNKRQKTLKESISKTSKGAKGKIKEKEHACDKGFIQIPQGNNECDIELSENDLAFFGEHVDAATSFLKNLDEKGIIRSKKEQQRLHQLSKPQRTSPRMSDLPSIDMHSEDEEEWEWSSGIGNDERNDIVSSDAGEREEETDSSVQDKHADSSVLTAAKRRRPAKRSSDDEELPFEVQPREQKAFQKSDSDEGISRLPIKLQNGQVRRVEGKVVVKSREDTEDERSDDDSITEEPMHPIVEDVSTGARFGRPAVADIISMESRKERIQNAKQQIASICQDIIANPEDSLGLLRRLHTFSLPQISTPTQSKPVENDILIRKLAILSQLAVFKDIIPGYRIRPLTEKENAEKVSQMVQRTRDFEQGLVSIYQNYLRTLEAEIKAKSELASMTLQCICRLLTDVTHFNFRTNLIEVVVSRLSKKSWDEMSDLCLKTLSLVFRADSTGQPSLEIVRLLNQMIKERRFNVHPNVMFCLLDLRLKTELGDVRASQSKSDKENTSDKMSRGKAAARRAKGKPTAQGYLSKKARKKLKETEAIEEEMREAEAKVDFEERAATQTETLKLLFVLYFRILKNDRPTPLLPAALQGISKFTHLVNVDFFRDLLQVLRDHVARGRTTGEEGSVEPGNLNETLPHHMQDAHRRIQCIVTAFELLSGQGEALDIDLSDFVDYLYSMIIPLSVMADIKEPIEGTKVMRTSYQDAKNDTPADMLFRALHLVFNSRTVSKSPPWRTAAFTKRLIIASLHFPAPVAIQTLLFIRNLFGREPQLDTLLSSEDRVADGLYRPDVDDPQLCNPFATNLYELQLLSGNHVDPSVRKVANELLHYARDNA